MTDLYDALRAAMTPDGRVRLTRELLTAMHEEGERRSRMDDTAQPDPLTEMRDRLLTATGRMREAESRAETAERELEGAERGADEQRERRKRAEVERDAAHGRAETAERERDNLLAVIHRERDAARAENAALIYARDAATARAYTAEARAVELRLSLARELLEVLGVPHGTEDVRDAARRIARAEMRADRDSWRQQCEDARSDALRYGRERDEANRERDTVLRERNTLITCARACLDPEIVSRDPAHARLAALVERIEGGAGEAPIVLEPLAVESRVWAARRGHIEPGTISNVERAGPDGWRCSIYFDEGSGVSWYGPREVAPMSPECDPRRNEGDQ